MVENPSDPVAPDLETEASEASPPSPPERPAFKDRKVALVAFGVVELLIALGVLLMALLQFVMAAGVGPFASVAAEGGRPGAFLAIGLFYLFGAIGVATLGVGSIYCRRWARALNLVLASVGLATGVFVSVMMVFIAPTMMRSMESQMGGAPPGMGFVMGCTAVGLAIMYLIIPAAFVFFYRSPHVKATCEHRDPKPRWTDRRPLPVLAGALLLFMGSGALFTPAMGMGVPFFGAIATGAAAWVVAGIQGLGMLVLSWGMFRLQRWAWLGAIVLTALSGVSMLVTFAIRDLAEMYSEANMPPETLEMMNQMGFPGLMVPLWAVSLLAVIAFYVWLGRYFKSADPA